MATLLTRTLQKVFPCNIYLTLVYPIPKHCDATQADDMELLNNL
jgi:hypothetical protein